MVKKLFAMLLSVLSSLVLVSGSWAQNCAPSFGPAQEEAVVVGAVRTALADFNRDGKADLITVDEQGVPTTRLRTDEGFGDARVSEYIRNLYQPAAIAIGYFDGDLVEGNFVVNPYPDIVVAARAGGVYLLTSDPYGYYSLRGTPVLRGFFAALAAADVNQDGMSDVIAVDESGGVVMLFSQADGNWGTSVYSPQTAQAYRNGEAPIAASLGYFDNALVSAEVLGGVPGLAVLTNQGRVLLYTMDTQSRFTVRETNFTLSFTELRAADLNQDQRTDLIAKDAAGQVYVLLRNANGEFAAPQAIGTAGVLSLLGVDDINGDSNLDVAVTMGEDAHFAWFGNTPGCPPPTAP